MIASLLEASGWLRKVSHDHFVSYPVQFVTQSHFNRSTLHDLHSECSEQPENQSQCITLHAADQLFNRGSADCRLVSTTQRTARRQWCISFLINHAASADDRMWGGGR